MARSHRTEGARVPSLRVRERAAVAVRRGHPWVYREALAGAAPSLEPGALVALSDEAGAPLGLGVYDPGSPIAVRVLTRDASARVDAGWLAGRVRAAIRRRDALLDRRETDAFRLCHGEGDRVPGLVLDRYAHVVVARTDGEAMARWLDRIADELWPTLAELGVTSWARRRGRDESPGEIRVEALRGEPTPPRVLVRENGVRMWVDLARGQKTGAFLDQRDNRRRVRELAAGRRVLNLFSYAGGFSIAAALGGAAKVTSVDVAHAAHATAQETFRENGVDPSRHAFVTADASAYLAGARARGEVFDLVVCDPPSYAPNDASVARGLAAYRKLHAACAALLAPSGILCAASCSSHVPMAAFLATLDDATLGREDLSVVGAFGPPADHPTLAGWPEGAYLKLVVLA